MWRQAPIEQASNKQRERIDPGRAVRDHRWGAALPRIRAARSLYRRTFPVMGAVDSERERGGGGGSPEESPGRGGGERCEPTAGAGRGPRARPSSSCRRRTERRRHREDAAARGRRGREKPPPLEGAAARRFWCVAPLRWLTQCAAAALNCCCSSRSLLIRKFGPGVRTRRRKAVTSPCPLPSRVGRVAFFFSFAEQVARRCWPRGVTRRRPHRERVARLRPSGLSTFFPVGRNRL
jgi:hypothetical protein